ncbi:MAG: OadG family protein [Spirochaetaceae bacterium]|jgi:sodium pump decarboxylase gamma subunit|nr:OadG family protein [Spirochaetaceae bacterium]
MNPLIEQSLQITLIGMGVVFLFLIILVCAVSAVGKIVPVLDRRQGEKVGVSKQDDEALVAAAIAIAKNSMN